MSREIERIESALVPASGAERREKRREESVAKYREGRW